MDSKMTPEQVEDYVRNRLRRSTQSFLGKPVDLEAIKGVVERTLSEMAEKGMIGVRGDGLKELESLFFLPFITAEERKALNPKALLQKIPTHTLTLLVQLFGEAGGIGHFLRIEYFTRMGSLSGWSFKWNDDGETGVTEIVVRHAVEFVHATFVIKDLETTGSKSDCLATSVKSSS